MYIKLDIIYMSTLKNNKNKKLIINTYSKTSIIQTN